MQDQLTEASLMGLTATSLASASLQDVENGKYQLIFASAEEILAKPFLSSLKRTGSALHQNLAAMILWASPTLWKLGPDKGLIISLTFYFKKNITLFGLLFIYASL